MNSLSFKVNLIYNLKFKITGANKLSERQMIKSETINCKDTN